MAKTKSGEFFSALAEMNRKGEWSFDSDSSDAVYTVIRHGDDKLSCNCRGWTQQVKFHDENFWNGARGRRVVGKYRICKHVRMTISGNGFQVEQRGDYLYVL
jgi:hypothetical protein